MKPLPSDFAPYFHYYVDLVSNNNLMDALNENLVSTNLFLASIPAEKENYKYQNDKWSIKEIVSHLIDTEMIFNYRALRFARGDKTELPGYDHDKYVENSNASKKPLSDLSDEYTTIRNSTIKLFKGFDDEALNKSGIASGNKLSVLSIGFINVGHGIHHLDVIKERYLK